MNLLNLIKREPIKKICTHSKAKIRIYNEKTLTAYFGCTDCGEDFTKHMGHEEFQRIKYEIDSQMR